MLTPNRWRLLQALKVQGPTSIRNLSQILQCDYRGVHADVAAPLDTGLIDRTDTGQIFVCWDRIIAEMDITQAA